MVRDTLEEFFNFTPPDSLLNLAPGADQSNLFKEFPKLGHQLNKITVKSFKANYLPSVREVVQKLTGGVGKNRATEKSADEVHSLMKNWERGLEVVRQKFDESVITNLEQKLAKFVLRKSMTVGLDVCAAVSQIMGKQKVHFALSFLSFVWDCIWGLEFNFIYRGGATLLI